MAGPFKMKGSSALGYGNQHSKGMKYASPNKDYSIEKGPHAHGATKYASPAKVDEKKKTEEKVKVNEFGETPEQYKKRMINMGLRKSDAEDEIDSKENKKASKRDKKAAGQ